MCSLIACFVRSFNRYRPPQVAGSDVTAAIDWRREKWSGILTDSPISMFLEPYLHQNENISEYTCCFSAYALCVIIRIFAKYSSYQSVWVMLC